MTPIEEYHKMIIEFIDLLDQDPTISKGITKEYGQKLIEFKNKNFPKKNNEALIKFLKELKDLIK